MGLIYILQMNLKTETLHHEGKILKFSKICHFFFPTYEEKSTDFKK